MQSVSPQSSREDLVWAVKHHFYGHEVSSSGGTQQQWPSSNGKLQPTLPFSQSFVL
jgi:hypothetical protein